MNDKHYGAAQYACDAIVLAMAAVIFYANFFAW